MTASSQLYFIWLARDKDCEIEKCFTMTGRMWVICPVSSNTMTDVEIVCVTAPAMAAAPGTEKIVVYS